MCLCWLSNGCAWLELPHNSGEFSRILQNSSFNVGVLVDCAFITWWRVHQGKSLIWWIGRRVESGTRGTQSAPSGEFAHDGAKWVEMKEGPWQYIEEASWVKVTAAGAEVRIPNYAGIFF